MKRTEWAPGYFVEWTDEEFKRMEDIKREPRELSVITPRQQEILNCSTTMTSREMAVLFGVSNFAMYSTLTRLRKRGFDIPDGRGGRGEGTSV